MKAAVIVETLSIDTQVFVAAGFGFGSKTFRALRDHFTGGRLKLVMTDITAGEVHARIKQSVAEELVHQRSFINKARALFNSSIPELKASLTKFDPDVVAKNLSDQFDSFLQEVKATIVKTDNLKAGNVLHKYFNGEPPFGPAENKRYEFPDAFAIQALAEWAEHEGISLFAVSGDTLFRKACEETKYLIPKASLAEVLDHVASDDEHLADFVRAETLKRMEEIRTGTAKEFQDRYYWVQNEDGDAEVEVTKLIPDVEPEIIEISNSEAVVQLGFDATYSAHLSYNDSATASYDSEDKRLIYWNRKEEEVEREGYFTVEVRVAYEQTDPSTFEIIDVSLSEPSEGFGIRTQEDYDWPYK